MQPTIAENFYIFSGILTAPKRTNFACKVTKESDRFAIAIFVGILTAGILTLIAYIFIKCTEAAPLRVSNPFFFHNGEKIHLRLLSLTQVLPSLDTFADYEDPISSDYVWSFIKDSSVSFVCLTTELIISTTTVAQFLSKLPAGTTLGYGYPSFWNSSKEFEALLEFLIRESTGDIKGQLESQLQIFKENRVNFQTLERSCNLINILEYLRNALLNKSTDAAEIAVARHGEIKNSFPSRVREFFFPQSIVNSNGCKNYAAAMLLAQKARLETLLERSEYKTLTEQEFEDQFSRLLQEIQEKYPAT